MNKLIKIAETFETKLQSIAETSDVQAIAKIFGKYEMMSEVLDLILEGMKINLTVLERESGGVHDEDIQLIKQETELIESAIMSVYAQVNAIDIKLQEQAMADLTFDK